MGVGRRENLPTPEYLNTDLLTIFAFLSGCATLSLCHAMRFCLLFVFSLPCISVVCTI
jgi:hypothetical protein